MSNREEYYLRTRVAGAERSSIVQLIVCLSVGIKSLLSWCAATAQLTSGGGGVGTRGICRGDPWFWFDMFDTVRRAVGELTFAINDCVGEE